jgi:hypothetical protein
MPEVPITTGRMLGSTALPTQKDQLVQRSSLTA